MQNKKINNILLILSFFPLIYIPGLIYPSISGKMFFIRTLIFLAFSLFCWYFLSFSNFRFFLQNKFNELKNNRILTSLIIYFLVFSVGIFFAIDKFTFLWGERRGEGFIGFLFYLIFLFLIFLLFKDKEYKNFLKISIIISVITSFYGVFQFLNTGMRVDSFFGNPAFLSTYLIFSIFSSLVIMSRRCPTPPKFLIILFLGGVQHLLSSFRFSLML